VCDEDSGGERESEGQWCGGGADSGGGGATSILDFEQRRRGISLRVKGGGIEFGCQRRGGNGEEWRVSVMQEDMGERK
jgi:hypothetical protein